MATPGVSDLSNGTSSVMMTAPFLQRVWTDDFPAVALEEFVAFVVVCRAALRERLDIAAGGGRGVEKQDAAGVAASVLPGMRDVARHERAGAGPADGDFVADLKGELADEHPGDLVAIAVQMEEALCTGGQGFLEHHDALVGLAAEELQGKRAAGRRRVEMLSPARGYDKAFCCGHVGVLPCGGMRIKRQRLVRQWPQTLASSRIVVLSRKSATRDQPPACRGATPQA